MCKTESESTGVGVCVCATEKGVEAVDFAYAAYEWILGGGRFGLDS